MKHKGTESSQRAIKCQTQSNNKRQQTLPISKGKGNFYKQTTKHH